MSRKPAGSPQDAAAARRPGDARPTKASWRHALWVALAAAALGSGCGAIYTNVRVPRAYRSPTPGDVKTAPEDTVVSGEACNHSILYLFAWGDASYAAATAKALEGRPGGVLYDVKTDVRATSVLLGLYARGCTVVTGKVGRL